MIISSHPWIKLLVAIIAAIVVGTMFDSWGWGIATFLFFMFVFIWVASWIAGDAIEGKVEVEVGWIKRTPKSNKIKRWRCQNERGSARKVYQGVQGGSGEAGNRGEAIIA